MGYNTNRLDATLADVIGETHEPAFELDLHDDWYLAINEDWFYAEPLDPEFDYDLHEVEDEEPPVEDLGHDPYEHLPHRSSFSASRHHFGPLWDGKGGRRPKFNVKPKRKDHRHAG